MAAYAGPFPWKRPDTKGKQGQKADWRKGYQYNVGIHRDKKTGREYDAGGWTVVQPDQYSKNPKKPEMVAIKLFNGRVSYVPVGDVRDFIGFHAMQPDQVTDEMAKEVEAAFEKESGRGRFYESGGRGHITAMRYNPSYQIMEVTFTKYGTVVTFFRIPSNIWNEFVSLAKSGTKMIGSDGKTYRHVLGIRFWDLIRIRGQNTGGRYPYTYTTTGHGVGSGAGVGEYVEAKERANATQADKPVDAHLEATITHQNEPSDTEVQKQETETLQKHFEGGFNDRQKEILATARSILMDKYGTRSPAYREFAAAVERGPLGWPAINQVLKTYKLRD